MVRYTGLVLVSAHFGGFTCDFMLPELVVLEGLLHGPDGCVVDVQKLLHGSWTERQSHS